MAQLNFPDPNTNQTYTEAGITWTWNDTLGVWSAEGGTGGGGGDVINYNGAAAWAHTSQGGDVAGSLNIASCTKESTGIYFYQFTTPLPNDDYSIVATADTNNTIGSYVAVAYDTDLTGFRIATKRADTDAYADTNHSVTVHATNANATKRRNRC